MHKQFIHYCDLAITSTLASSRNVQSTHPKHIEYVMSSNLMGWKNPNFIDNQAP
jgi:hypothetical protein